MLKVYKHKTGNKRSYFVFNAAGDSTNVLCPATKSSYLCIISRSKEFRQGEIVNIDPDELVRSTDVNTTYSPLYGTFFYDAYISKLESIAKGRGEYVE